MPLTMQTAGDEVVIEGLECAQCKGAGVVRSVADAVGLAWQCPICDGSGQMRIVARPFKRLRSLFGINQVKVYQVPTGSRGCLPEVVTLPYKTFMRGERKRQRRRWR